MDGFFLLLGHLAGDYLLQNDWQAKNKVNPFPGFRCDAYCKANNCGALDYWRVYDRWLMGHLACTVHCLLYTLAVWACSFWWLPVWGLLVCFLAHWPIDRFRLAGWWMDNVSGQAFFASDRHPLFPWSVVVVDNTFHLLTLGLIAALAGRVG